MTGADAPGSGPGRDTDGIVDTVLRAIWRLMDDDCAYDEDPQGDPPISVPRYRRAVDAVLEPWPSRADLQAEIARIWGITGPGDRRRLETGPVNAWGPDRDVNPSIAKLSRALRRRLDDDRAYDEDPRGDPPITVFRYRRAIHAALDPWSSRAEMLAEIARIWRLPTDPGKSDQRRFEKRPGKGRG
jgi:hypothetical protein